MPTKVTAEVYDQFIPENQRNVVDKLGSFVTNVTKQKDSDLSLEHMVARDGVEPTPPFSGLHSPKAICGTC